MLNRTIKLGHDSAWVFVKLLQPGEVCSGLGREFLFSEGTFVMFSQRNSYNVPILTKSLKIINLSSTGTIHSAAVVNEKYFTF